MADILDIGSGNITTSNATPVVVTSFGFTSGQAACGELIVIAQSDNNNKAFWKFGFLAYRSGDDVTIINQLLGLVGDKTLGAALWDAYLDNGDGTIEVKVKGVNNVNINWYGSLLWGYSIAAPS